MHTETARTENVRAVFAQVKSLCGGTAVKKEANQTGKTEEPLNRKSRSGCKKASPALQMCNNWGNFAVLPIANSLGAYYNRCHNGSTESEG